MNLVERVKTLWRLFTTGGMTKTDKWLLIIAAIYCLSPIDIIPDVVPIVGILDDLLVVLLALRQMSNKTAADSPMKDGIDAKQVDAKVV